MPFWLGPLLRLSVLIAASLAVGIFLDATAGGVLLVAGLVSVYAFHLTQLARLTRWLDQAQRGIRSEVPESVGEWGDAFAALHRLRRNEQAGRERLADSLDRLRLAAEALPDAVVLLDHVLRIEWCNSAATRYLGTDAVRDRGVPISHLIREPAFAAYLHAERQGEPVIIRSATAPQRILSLSLIPFAESGRLLICRDITALERADTVRRDFVANVSHELRTPLTVIVGFLEGLAAGDAVEASALGRQYDLMYDQALRMERLVKDLLTLSALDDTQPPANEERVDVPALLTALVAEGRALSGGQHELTLDAATGNLHGSREELRSAFSNLITNAVRYTPANGSVRVRWTLRNDSPVFEVTDNGIGIAPEHIQRLTERFYRVDTGRSSASGGTGLGLAIVKHVLIRHQAKLEIESAPGRGSTFRAVFPAARRC